MTLYEYIEKREQVLDKRMEKIMGLDDINLVQVALVNSAIVELEQIKIAIEEGVIVKGENNDSM